MDRSNVDNWGTLGNALTIITEQAKPSIPTSPRSANTATPEVVVPLAELLRRVQAGDPLPAFITVETGEAAEAACRRCGDTRWINDHPPRTDPAFGKMQPCPDCYAPVIGQVRLDRLFRHAGVPREHFAALDFTSYTATAGDQTARALVEAWADDDATDCSLLLYGLYGRGKTGLAIAAMRRRIERRGCEALFRTVPELLADLRGTYDRTRHEDDEAAPTEQDLIGALQDAALLVLDDLGAEQHDARTGRASEWAQDRLFVVLNQRHDRHRPTIVTSNLDLYQLGEQLGPRISWRIKEMCGPHVVELIGPNLRDRDAA